MNARKQGMISNPPKKIKGTNTSPGSSNIAKPVKNAVAMKGIGSTAVKPVRNSGSCMDY